MKAVAIFGLFISRVIYSQNESSVAEPVSVRFTCDTKPCVITPQIDDKLPTFIILTNEYQDCTVNCVNSGCNSQEYPLTIYSGCATTTVNCLNINGTSKCENIVVKSGELIDSDIDDLIKDTYTSSSFAGLKQTSTINCGSFACKLGLFRFTGSYNNSVHINSDGDKSIETSVIDCEDIDGQCYVNCGDNFENCIKNILLCPTPNILDCGCQGTCDKDGKTAEVVDVIYPPVPQEPNCDAGAVVISPSGSDVICTSGCDICIVDCETGACGSNNYPNKNFRVYSGASSTEIRCGGSNEKNCEFGFIRVGELKLDSDLPPGYDYTSFAGPKNNFNLYCDGKLGCTVANIKAIGNVSNVFINADGTDAFQNSKLDCNGPTTCTLECAFEGCDGSMFDCNGRENSLGCSCVNLPTNITSLNLLPNVTNTTGLTIADYLTLLVEPLEGPTCPPINLGEPFDFNRKAASHEVSNTNTSHFLTNHGTKVGLSIVLSLGIIACLLYYIFYNTKLCRKISIKNYENDVKHISKYETFNASDEQVSHSERY